MAEEVVSLRASGGHLSVTRLLSLTSPLPAWIHCQAFHKHCLNYISKVAVIRGVKRGRRHRGRGSEWGIKKKGVGAREKERNGFWIRVLGRRVKCRGAKYARTSLIRTITTLPYGVQKVIRPSQLQHMINENPTEWWVPLLNAKTERKGGERGC